MIGIPWVEFKLIMAELGSLPLLGWPKGIDPFRCVFAVAKGGGFEAIFAGVVVAKWIPGGEWESLL